MTARGGRVVHVTDEVPGAIYIGRRFPRLGLAGSPFANPFRIGRDGDRRAVLTAYRRHALRSADLLAALPGLRGKPLACWCRHDGDDRPGASVCHGDVLIELLAAHADDELRAMAAAVDAQAATRRCGGKRHHVAVVVDAVVEGAGSKEEARDLAEAEIERRVLQAGLAGDGPRVRLLERNEDPRAVPPPSAINAFSAQPLRAGGERSVV